MIALITDPGSMVCSYSHLQSMILAALGYLAEVAIVPGVAGWFLGGVVLRVFFSERRR